MANMSRACHVSVARLDFSMNNIKDFVRSVSGNRICPMKNPTSKASILIISLTICLQWKAKRSLLQAQHQEQDSWPPRLAESWGAGFVAEQAFYTR